MSPVFPFADRLRFLQANVFADMDNAKQRAVRAGKDPIDLSLGSADLPTDPTIITTITRSLQDPFTHRYVLFAQTRDFRATVANWLEKRFAIVVDPETEVLPLIGSQEGTAHFPLAVLNSGDVALLQDPGYPSHYGGVYLASGQPWPMPLRSEQRFLPDFSAIPIPVLRKSRMMVLSYPHNPTTATASLAFFQEAVQFCQHHGLVLVHDFPYMDFVFGPEPAPAMLQADREKSVTIEFFTLSKSYNMGGFRVGFAVGNRHLIQALRQIKAVVDFNQYQGILQGGIQALESDYTIVKRSVLEFQKRRDLMVNALEKLGWQVPVPPATMYIWAPLPAKWQGSALSFCQELIAETGVALAPGSGFGQQGEGFVRFALVHSVAVLQEAADRIEKFLARI